MLRVWQSSLPDTYTTASEEELQQRILAAKKRLGGRLAILGHHYQQDSVMQFADFAGDSFELSRLAAAQKGIEYVIFCGVHFMAESADLLTEDAVKVILPDLGAGCSMADMANLEQTLDCWATLEEMCPDQHIVPITYMNSSAALKAFVGEHGGAVCTSSNAQKVIRWALDQQKVKKNKILFFPDQHLGRNTAFAMGYPLDRMVMWDPFLDLGGNEDEDKLIEADFVLWRGHCSVHGLFRPEHADQAREKYPGMKILVHPECCHEVVQKADLTGSTSYIIKQVEAAPPGSKWAIGTEVHLVNRLKNRFPEQQIIVLSDCQCLCTTMYRIDAAHLCWAMENLVEGTVVNQVRVEGDTRRWAMIALQRMLDINAGKNPSWQTEETPVLA